MNNQDSASQQADLTASGRLYDGAEGQTVSAATDSYASEAIAPPEAASRLDQVGAAGEVHPPADTLVASPDVAAERPTTRRQRRYPRIPRPKIRVHTLDSLKIRNFRLIWILILCLGGSDWLVSVVIGWMTFDLTHSPLLTSLALGLGGLPFLVLGPIAGVIADSWDRRKLILIALAGQMTLAAAFAAIVVAGYLQTWHIFAIITLFGVAAIFLHSTILPMITNVVPRRYLLNAFALDALAFNMTRLVVPAAAGVSIALVGPGITLLAAVALYAGAAVSAYAIRLEDAEGSAPRRRPSLAHFFEGVRYLRREPLVIALLLMGLMPMILLAPVINGLMPVFASEVFHVGPAGLGFLVSSLGLGATAGAIVIASFGDIRRKGVVLYGALGTGVVSMVAFAFSSEIAVSIPILMVIAGTMSLFFSVTTAVVQDVVPDEMRGRMAAISGMPIGLFPLGALLAGAIAEVLGAPAATIILAGIFAVVLAAFAAVFPRVWRLN